MMTVNVPEFTAEEIQSLLDDLSAKGNEIPQPQDVEVVAAEDHDGEPAYFLTVVFPKKEDPAKLRWKTVSPFVDELRERVFNRGGADRPVIARVIRLAEQRTR